MSSVVCILSVIGKADFLVSGDQDLLVLDGKFACPIITADQFMETIKHWMSRQSVEIRKNTMPDKYNAR